MQVGFHGQHHSTRCSYASLLGGTASSLFIQNKRRNKPWKHPAQVLVCPHPSAKKATETFKGKGSGGKSEEIYEAMSKRGT